MLCLTHSPSLSCEYTYIPNTFLPTKSRTSCVVKPPSCSPLAPSTQKASIGKGSDALCLTKSDEDKMEDLPSSASQPMCHSTDQKQGSGQQKKATPAINSNHTHTHTQSNTHAHTHIHTQSNTHTRTHTYTHSHTQTKTHTQTHTLSHYLPYRNLCVCVPYNRPATRIWPTKKGHPSDK